MNRKNIFIHQQIIPEYRIPILNKILDKYENCYVIYGNSKKNSSLKNGKKPTNKNYLKTKNIFLFGKQNYYLTCLFQLLFKYKPKIIITQYSPGNIDVFLFYLLRPFLKFKLIGWYHGWNRKKNYSPNKTFYDKLRHFMLKKADGVILYSEDAKIILSKYKDPSKIFVANNTLDTETYTKLREQFHKTGREILKEKLNFKSKYNLIFSARLEAEKNPKALLRIYQLLRQKNSDISLHIIGSGSLENELKSIVKNQNIENVIFYGSIYDDEITGSIIYCSDLMIIPKWVGLSIIHSFSFECPIVTFDEKCHPPEIIYLIHGKTGYNFGKYSDMEIAESIIKYLLNETLQAEFRKNVLEMVATNASVDKMIGGISEAINYFSTTK
ncbi:MAG: glycosyltransferase family 4 protein [Bacteroidales bacterium]|jgi:glycosyltransferase involved in cell wall biosynthesis